MKFYIAVVFIACMAPAFVAGKFEKKTFGVAWYWFTIIINSSGGKRKSFPQKAQIISVWIDKICEALKYIMWAVHSDFFTVPILI